MRHSLDGIVLCVCWLHGSPHPRITIGRQHIPDAADQPDDHGGHVVCGANHVCVWRQLRDVCEQRAGGIVRGELLALCGDDHAQPWMLGGDGGHIGIQWIPG